ncbi:MAG: polysaccharide deacetylase family protein [Polyangiaceae bacterium]
MRRIALVSSLLLVTGGALSACSGGDDHDHSVVSPGASQAFEDAFEQTEFGKADSSGCSGVVVPDSSGFNKRVALTFDDGPNPETTPQVLDILEQHGIQATFFINGMRVTNDAARAVLGRILAEGHILANHSQQHLNLKNESATKVEQQVKQTHEIILSAGASPKYFRFPFGSANCKGIDIVHGYGLTVTGWHIDSGDWCYAAAKGGVGYCHPDTFRYVPDSFRSDMVGYTLSQVRKRSGGIVLFHDIHQNTVNNLESVISTLEGEGYTFVKVDDTDTFPQLNGAPPVPKPFVGDPCTKDEECNFTNGSATGTCHLFTPSGTTTQQGFCTVGCEGYCPDQAGKAKTFCASLDAGQSGSCVSKSETLNDKCAGLPGTSEQTVQRFVGSSGAPPVSAAVCLPN